TTTRLCINLAQSARERRETYIGSWLPEPVDTSSDPGLGAERGEALKLAVLVLLEKLTLTERAAYVLREAFEYPYRQIADHSANGGSKRPPTRLPSGKHIADGRPRPSVRRSSVALWRPLSARRKRETWLDWKDSLLRMLSPTRMAVGLCARRGFQLLV